MNEFESDWISLIQSQSGVRVFLSESERRQQGVWIKDGSVWIQHGRIQDGCNHQVEWKWMSQVFFCANWLNPWWQNSRWQNSRWLWSSSWVRMNEWSFFCAFGGNQYWQVWVNLKINTKIAESKMAKFKMATIIKLSENERVWVRLN